MKLSSLLTFTGVLFVLSLFVYTSENKRGTDLLSGSDYIKGLDIGKIHKIILSFNGNKKITLTRDSGRFVLENHKSYPAASDKVNELIYKVASIQVNKKITSRPSEEDLKKYELDTKSSKYLVELYDNNGKKTVSFRVGKNHKGKGNYLYKEGQNDVYLSNATLWINSSYKDFVDTLLLDINKDKIEKISLKSDKNLEIAKKENEFKIVAPENLKVKKDKLEEYTKSFSSIRFDDFYTLTEPKVRSLSFDKDIKIQLKNKLVYKVSLAKDKDDHFLRLTALLEENPRQFVVRQEDGKEELQKIEDTIKAQSDAQRLNLEKGAWVYKVNQSVYEKLAKDSKFFL